MSKKHLNRRLSKITRSVLTVSMATISLNNQSILNLNNHSHLTKVHATTGQSSNFPDVSNIHYDSTYGFESSDNSWTKVETNSEIGVFASNTTYFNNRIAYTDQTATMLLFNPHGKKLDSNYTFENPHGTVFASGKMQEVYVDGQLCYGISIDKNTTQQAIQSFKNDLLTNFYFDGVNGQMIAGLPTNNWVSSAQANLPSVSITENGKLASDALVGKSITVTDSSGQNHSVALKKEWINVINDASKPGSYSYTLNSDGVNGVQDAIKTEISGKYSNIVFYYRLDSMKPGSVTINQKTDQQASLTISYVDQATGKTIKTNKIEGPVGKSGKYTASVPSGYKLADGQDKVLNYQITDDDSDNLVIKIVKEQSDSPDDSDPDTPSHDQGPTPTPVPAPTPSRPIQRGTATVVLVDDATGKAIATFTYNGFIGTRINPDIQRQILDLMRQGYNLVRNDLRNGLVFTQKDQTYYLHFEKSTVPPMRSAVKDGLQATQSTSDKPEKSSHHHKPRIHENIKHQKQHQSKQKQHHQKHRKFNQPEQAPSIANLNGSNMHGLDGGGGNNDADISLGDYFAALAGIVNFSQRPNSID